LTTVGRFPTLYRREVFQKVQSAEVESISRSSKTKLKFNDDDDELSLDDPFKQCRIVDFEFS